MKTKTCVRCGKESQTTSPLCENCDSLLEMDEELKATLIDKNRSVGYGFLWAILFLALLLILALANRLGFHIPTI